ncbi:Uncharacterized protein dnm_010850 [Desulfonema magnum]|uniref:Uncharacterized protein n=1 Tax=Desulfonema magnum TaxID=45655 RepID=A0A975BGN6_9BACT|nr:Uncharacterized protein dnm_010850 [Desulfonema magnum]
MFKSEMISASFRLRVRNKLDIFIFLTYLICNSSEMKTDQSEGDK